MNEHGYPMLAPERYWEMRRARMPLRAILEETGAAEFAETFAKEHYDRIEDRRYLEIDEVIPHMRSVLDVLKSQGRLALATLRRSAENLHWQLERLGLRSYFDRILSQPGGADAWNTKQQMIASLGEIWGCRLVIGDTEADILAGGALGLPTCAVTYGIRNETYLRQLGPTYVIQSPDELLPLIGAHGNGG
jgi:phosphoglycolate phosphatase-like HAD superfamily hydrolase